ncbi:cytochrome P450 4C1-like [Orussus abietinus]|uniref:cytochrome P450 4C1-like n=1 Tax=Orussus abietinus TaxID=222816 RepID=UPI000C715CD2|nr:cytochrome P450 4C1-like [Orussus abietinus]
MVLVRQMEVEVEGKEFDVFKYVSLCTLDIICETAMGVSLNAQTNADCNFPDAANRLLELLAIRAVTFWLHPDIIFKYSQLAKEQNQCIKYLHDVINNVIRKKKAALTKNEESQKNEDGPRKKIFLDLLMELTQDGTKFKDEELRDQVNTLIIAGNDTNANVSSFVMLMLASFPDIQEKVYQEQLNIYGPTNIENVLLKEEDLQRMEYLERVIKETMRLFPVLPFLVRKVTEDLDIGSYTLPKGSTVMVEIIKLHRMEEYWPSPEKFDPDRFSPEEVAKRHPYCYAPFSAGPRNCLGIKYAMMATKALLSTVLRNYRLIKDNAVPVFDIQLKANFILKPVESITLRIERRNRKL